MQKIKISAVSYTNSLPFIYGIENSNFLNGSCILHKDFPAACADKLKSDQVDLGLIPVAEILNLKNPYIISDYCIGAYGEVKTVLLLSNVPLNNIKTILLDYQSRTSVNLVQVLAQNYWNINPDFINAQAGFENMIEADTAAVLIGDRTFNIQGKYEYVYDLALEWKNFTGLPFVFAAWVANKKLPDEFIRNFNNACRFGLERIDDVIEKYAKHINYPVKNYLTNDISYNFDDKKKEAMNKFLDFIKKN